MEPVKEALTQSLFDHIPVGVGSQVRFRMLLLLMCTRRAPRVLRA